jgi:phage/plasmid primase-like uncharacterized protein
VNFNPDDKIIVLADDDERSKWSALYKVF